MRPGIFYLFSGICHRTASDGRHLTKIVFEYELKYSCARRTSKRPGFRHPRADAAVRRRPARANGFSVANRPRGRAILPAMIRRRDFPVVFHGPGDAGRGPAAVARDFRHLGRVRGRRTAATRSPSPIRSPAPATAAASPRSAIGRAGRRADRPIFRLSRAKREGSAVLLRIDDRTFQLRGGGADAWAADPAADAEIVSAMRTGIEMNVETRSASGALVRDSYRLRGAATAIDAAAIACAAADG